MSSVQAVEAFTPYVNVTSAFSGGLPTWMDTYDAERINSYQTYEQMYWNVPETFKLVMRGEENNTPIYIPTARTLVDTTNRYLCPVPGFVVEADIGTPEQRAQCRLMFSNLFRRERFWSKFQANKLYGLLRGDWCWHVMANPAKPPGRRIKIEPIDPGAYFPVFHSADPERIIAVHLAEEVVDDEDNVFIRRQTYQVGADPKNNDGSDRTIYNSIGLFDSEAWQDLEDEPQEVVKPLTPLPAQITAIPIYHIRNIETPGDPFGSSELRGFERIMAAVNQAVSDEEIALALEGLGMYATDGGPPRDAQGRVTDWILGPGRVVEHGAGSKFTRINGVSSVQPVQDHLKFLINSLKEASATPDVAIGRVDVSVAESGIALALQLGPMLSKVEVRKEPITDVHTQMYHDLRMWFRAYEQFDTPCVVVPVFGSNIPEDRDTEIERILSIVAAGLADAEWGREQLAEYGYVFEDDMAGRVVREKQLLALATDPFGSRMDAEQDSEEDEA